MLYEDVSPSGDDRDPLTPAAGWWRLRIKKHDEFLRFFVNDRLALEYREKRPLTGTRLGLWTLGTPMAVSRVRIACSESPAAQALFASDASAETANKGGTVGLPPALAPLELVGIGLAALCDHANSDAQAGVIASVDPAQEAVKVTNARCGGAFRFPLITAPAHAGSLGFDLMCAPDIAVNLYVRANGKSLVIPITGNTEHPRGLAVLPRPRLSGKPDGWRTVDVDLAALLSRALPGVKQPVVDELWLGNASSNWRLAAGLSGNRLGSSYCVRAVRLIP